MEEKSKDIFTITKEEYSKEYELIQKITNTFKISNVTNEGDKMLIDLSNVKTSEGPQSRLIPAGNYNATLATCELKLTSDGTGKYLRTMWKLNDYPYKNRTVFHNFNIESTNPKAQEIGQGYIKKLLIINKRTKMQIYSWDELIGLRAKIYVKTKQNATYGDSNIIVNFIEADPTTDGVTLDKSGAVMDTHATGA